MRQISFKFSVNTAVSFVSCDLAGSWLETFVFNIPPTVVFLVRYRYYGE